MNQEQKNTDEKKLPPAGEARGVDLPPQGQGGPHPPPALSKTYDNEPPAKKTLAEQFESGPSIVDIEKEAQQAEQPHGIEVLTSDPPHKCSICGSPDHRACGCEAKAKKDSRLEKEIATDELLEKVFENFEKSEILKLCEKSGKEFAGFIRGLDDSLGDLKMLLQVIADNTSALVEMQRERAKVLEDIKNGSSY